MVAGEILTQVILGDGFLVNVAVDGFVANYRFATFQFQSSRDLFWTPTRHQFESDVFFQPSGCGYLRVVVSPRLTSNCFMMSMDGHIMLALKTIPVEFPDDAGMRPA